MMNLERPAAASRSAHTIESVRTAVVVRPMDAASWNPRTRWREKRVVLAFVRLADGTMGIGEAYCDGGDPASVQSIIERDLAPLLVGQDALAIRRHLKVMLDSAVVSVKSGACHAAASALDIALWDAAGKALGQPVWRLLGGGTDWVPVYASGGLYGAGKSPADLAAEMASYVERGFRAVKIKVGGIPIAQDIARVRAVRQAIGADIALMVDALYAYSAQDALRFANAAHEFDIHFFEAPVHPDDDVGLRQVCDRSPIPVAGNEFAYGADGFRRLIADAGVQVVHADAILCGGVSGALRIADFAQAYHRSISFHAASSLVCLMANAHVAAAAGNAESVEYHMIHQVLFDRANPLPFALENGGLRLGHQPGLGVELVPHPLDDAG